MLVYALASGDIDMITRRETLAGMAAAFAVAGTGLLAAKADEVARDPATRDYAGWDNATLRGEVFDVDHDRFLAHASLYRDYLAVSRALPEGDAERIAHYHARAAQRVERVVAPANAAWRARGVPMVRELARRGEAVNFSAYTLEDRTSYRDFIHAFDRAAEAGAPDELARVVALHEIGHSWLEACEMVIDKGPMAAIAGRMLEVREMRGGFGNVT